MNDSVFKSSAYSVAYAINADVGKEWNDLVWDADHRHIQYHRLYFLTEGKAKIYLYDSVLDLVPGFVYFIPAYSVRKSYIEGTMNKYYIHFQSEIPYLSFFRYLSHAYSYKASETTEYLFRTVVDNYSLDTLDSKFKTQGAMDMLLSDFLSEISIEAPIIKRFDKVLSYIDENYKKPISLSELSTIMNLNQSYFGNFFKSTFNISPKKYILNKRIAEAQKLLIETDMTIKEIAYEVGFENENYFSELFKQRVGITAKKFRARSGMNLRG